MRVRILQGNQTGDIVDVCQSEGENMITTGYGETAPAVAEKPEPTAEPPAPEPDAEPESPEPDDVPEPDAAPEKPHKPKRLG